MKRKNTDIVISGGGIAGLTAAAAFGTAGFDVVVIDPAPPVTNIDDAGADLRTTAFLQPAQRLLEDAGLWDRLAPFATPLDVMRIVDAAAEPPVVRDFDAADISDQPFGWNLPNWLLRREMVDRLAELDRVEFRPGVGFSAMVPRLNETLVTLSDDASLRAKLVIGADGRHSAVRQAAGIDTKTTRYGQKAVVFAVTHDAPHDNVSTEIHRAGGPFTLVPLPDYDGSPCSAVVWMDAGPEIHRLAELPAEAFESAANDRSAWRYGPLKLATRRTVWPIISQTAARLTAPRTALMAEAAHVMPPIGAQGLNMSLKDLACLLDLAATHDLGSPQMLDAYARKRHPDIKLRVAGIDALNRASIMGNPALQTLRAKGIEALYGVKPVRQTLMEMGLGAR
ncbi:UbiH/UbiF family hydroxylase [Yoonia sediminilitoris]|uniref:2-octaprenyl-6-methoxyphenol hydroxylase n=1 Tax=Yoonia sediminilitoris TaxID=1286148 RepID=A0A2T6KEJ4_9RHOB|nr:UbiH/UbiF family hydroxylase [Yoonia sediminilitoris]PUB13550.1 2-octaprenyl-6-methoxyphenol hydroxylase [Yoonia sediminilitoris]RCW94720.1 2-octaprenyl-6-methoxyphenol hydroxylase [Yoonia sediminilitoris]